MQVPERQEVPPARCAGPRPTSTGCEVRRVPSNAATSGQRRALGLASTAMSDGRLHHAFLGWWRLIPESCNYEQGDPPTDGWYRIAEEPDRTLSFTARWTDSDEKRHEIRFAGPPDGSRVPFAGGELADALAIEAVSSRELNSYAYYRGVERMVAQRQLDGTGQAMRVVQLVRLPGGASPANVSVYRRSSGPTPH